MSAILLVEDERVLRAELRRLLTWNGHEVAEAGSVKEATSGHTLGDFDLIISDLRLPDLPGTELITRAPGVPVLIMTSYATVKSAVEAMRMGAVDYIAKPLDHDELLLLVRQILAAGQQARLARPAADQPGLGGMIGHCPAMLDGFERLRRVAATESTVLILGESGTGKELAARAVHALSSRRDAPIISVNCAAIPIGLIESELFGHEKGAFTGAAGAHAGLIEAAHGGTLFLDEIAELPLPVQGHLLRVLQDGEVRRVGSTQIRRVNIRLIAATHRDLAKMVQDGSLRADLYFRLRVVDIVMPPLRERGGDIDELALVLLDKICARLNRPRVALGEETMKAIRAHSWPGNVRELENALERAVILSGADVLLPKHLGLGVPISTAAAAVQPAEDPSLTAYFKRFVLTHQDHMSETELAAKLGISRKTLWERRLRYSVPKPRGSD
jgi:DNA-binding NtrC family response regulator